MSQTALFLIRDNCHISDSPQTCIHAPACAIPKQNHDCVLECPSSRVCLNFTVKPKPCFIHLRSLTFHLPTILPPILNDSRNRLCVLELLLTTSLVSLDLEADQSPPLTRQQLENMLTFSCMYTHFANELSQWWGRHQNWNSQVDCWPQQLVALSHPATSCTRVFNQTSFVPKHSRWDMGGSWIMPHHCGKWILSAEVLFQSRLCCACPDCHYAQLELP